MHDRYVRVCCVQLSPVFKDVEASIASADALANGLEPGALDVLVMPEMAFPGYCFESRGDVAPFVEDPEKGRSAQWARKTAKRLGCYVFVGAPTFSSTASAASAPLDEPQPHYNSLLVMSPCGDLLHVYHKNHLYETDETWATEGPSFATFDLPFPPSSPFHFTSPSSPVSASSPANQATFRVAPAICMDLNPYRFKAPFDAFEFGTFAAQEKVDLVIASCAWLDSEPPLVSDDDATAEDGEKGAWGDVMSTLSYWATRLEPLLGSEAGFVCSNRVGREGETVFTGSSCVMRLGASPAVLAYAGKRREKLVVARLALPQLSSAEAS
ncbi:hypothetical protein JCM11641_006198 [Rhodosporidiobolus odoratus]